MFKLLDLFCGAGGCSYGYHQAGFKVTGVDINPMPNYPFKFIQADAIEYVKKHGHKYDVIHASPPCQIHSTMTKGIHPDKLQNHVDLIPDTRAALIQSGKLYVIENVEGAKRELINPLMLCGTMFNLRARNGAQLRRHRYFETNPPIYFPPGLCQHERQPAIGVYGGGQHPQRKNGKNFYGIVDRRIAMGIEWMTGKELNQAIPPAYTEFIGRRLMQVLEEKTK